MELFSFMFSRSLIDCVTLGKPIDQSIFQWNDFLFFASQPIHEFFKNHLHGILLCWCLAWFFAQTTRIVILFIWMKRILEFSVTVLDRLPELKKRVTLEYICVAAKKVPELFFSFLLPINVSYLHIETIRSVFRLLLTLFFLFHRQKSLAAFV